METLTVEQPLDGIGIHLHLMRDILGVGNGMQEAKRHKRTWP